VLSASAAGMCVRYAYEVLEGYKILVQKNRYLELWIGFNKFALTHERIYCIIIGTPKLDTTNSCGSSYNED